MEGKEAPHRLRTGLILTVASFATALLLAPSAQAGLLVKSATDCDEQTIENPFTRWLDTADYVAVPGGAFEGEGPDWSSSSASSTSGNEPWNVREAGDDDDTSLVVPSGGTVTSRSLCVGLEHPTLRFFARSKGSTVSQLLSALTVEVLFEDATGRTRSLPIGVVKSPTGWAPTLPMVVVANLLPLLPGEQTAVAFRFTAVGGASWQLDDVYVDPKTRR
jgi:hypothetical protein